MSISKALEILSPLVEPSHPNYVGILPAIKVNEAIGILREPTTRVTLTDGKEQYVAYENGIPVIPMRKLYPMDDYNIQEISAFIPAGGEDVKIGIAKIDRNWTFADDFNPGKRNTMGPYLLAFLDDETIELQVRKVDYYRIFHFRIYELKESARKK